MSEIKTKIRTYNDVIDLFGEDPPSARKSSINLPNISNLPALPAGSSCPESMSWIPMR